MFRESRQLVTIRATGKRRHVSKSKVAAMVASGECLSEREQAQIDGGYDAFVKASGKVSWRTQQSGYCGPQVMQMAR